MYKKNDRVPFAAMMEQRKEINKKYPTVDKFCDVCGIKRRTFNYLFAKKNHKLKWCDFFYFNTILQRKFESVTDVKPELVTGFRTKHIDELIKKRVEFEEDIFDIDENDVVL